MDKIINILKEDNDYIVLSNKFIKDKLLLALSDKLRKITFKSFEEFTSEILGEVTLSDLVTYTLDNPLDNIEVSSLKLKNSIFFEDENINPELYKINQQYIKKHVNKDVLNKLYNKKMYVINYYGDDDLVNLSLQKLSTKVIKLFTTKDNKEVKINYFSSSKEEVFYTVNQIYNLLLNGVSGENIVINLCESNYELFLKEALELYNIDYQIDKAKSLSSYEYTKSFLKKLFSKNGSLVETLSEVICESDSKNELLKEIVNALNPLNKFDLYINDKTYDIVKYILDNHTFTLEKYTNCIKIENVFENIYDSNTHIFIMNFNQDVIPKTFKDNAYLKDSVKKAQNLLTSTELNIITKNKTIDYLINADNLHLSYSLLDLYCMLVRNNLIDALSEKVNCQEEYIKEDITRYKNESYAKILYKEALDDYNKYNEKSDSLIKGNSYFKKEIKLYDHSYSGVSDEVLDNFLNGVVFSQTAIEMYYSCSFRYYLSYILKLRKPVDDTAFFIGNLFHDVLEKLLKVKKLETLAHRVERYTNNYVKTSGKKMTKKLEFYVNSLKGMLLETVRIIKEYEKASTFKVWNVEKTYTTDINGYKFIGRIDKILKSGDYYVVVDYKSNDVELDLKNVDKGMKLQLPSYVLLIKKNINESKIAGCYLQSVLSNNKYKIDKTPYAFDATEFDSKFRKDRKYVGYSLLDRDVVMMFDSNHDSDASSLRGGVLKKNGEFKNDFLKKAFTSEEFDRLTKLTERKLSEAIEDIKTSEFKINPMKLALSTSDPCQFCSFKDVCYKTNFDYNVVYPNKDFSFLIEEDE